MVQLVLKEEEFNNNKFLFRYGNREALFTIVDEEFKGNNGLGRINRVTILVRGIGKNDSRMCSSIIGFGDGVTGIRTDEPSLRGKPINKDNMSECIIMLYEDGDG